MTVSEASSVSSNYGGTISDGASRTVSLVVSGSGVLILSGTNTYTGGTTVMGGTLEIASPSAMPTTGIINVGRPGRVDLRGLLAAYIPHVGEEETLGAAANPQAGGDAVGTADESATIGGDRNDMAAGRSRQAARRLHSWRGAGIGRYPTGIGWASRRSPSRELSS